MSDMPPSLFDFTMLSLRQAVNPFVLLIIIFVVAVLLSNPVRKTISGKILFFILGGYGLMSFNSMLMSFGLSDIFIWLLFSYFPITLFIAPLCYLYIRSLVDEQFRIGMKEKLHFLIPVLSMALSLVVNMFIGTGYISDNDDLYSQSMDVFIGIQDITLFYILFLQFVLYSVLCIRLYVRHIKNIEHFFSYSEGVSLRWIRVFIAGMMIYFFVFLLSNNEFLFIPGISDSTYDIAHFSITVFFIFLIGAHGVGQRNVFEQPQAATIQPVENHEPEKIPSFVLDAPRKAEMAKQISQLLESERLYLNPSLTLDFLANRISSNRSYTSHVINECFGMSFYNLVNKYRIEESIKMLQDGKHGNYSVEGIAGLCGFTSRSSFNSAFRKFTGKTPSDFRMIS